MIDTKLLQCTCFITLLSAITFSVTAQKLPDVQTRSLALPASVLVDGKTIEWNNTFQAFNRQTNIFYAMANSASSLYVVIQAKDMETVKKIIAGGISLMLNTSGSKTDKNGVVITYPLMSGIAQSRTALHYNELIKLSDRKKSGEITLQLAELNKEITSAAKEIKVKGIKELNDTLISVYNRQGLKAKILFDNQLAFTYELLIPLKYLGISIEKSPAFSYHVILNGLKSITVRTNKNTVSSNVESVTMIPRGISNGPASNSQNLNFPTDFWGTYSLARAK
jgi:hypothetical protein